MSHLPIPKRAQRGSPSHNRAPVQEREIAARVGGKVTKASGAQSEKGDARIKGLVRIEAKCTINKSFSVTRETLRKIEDAALGAGEVPYLEVELMALPGQPAVRVAVMPVWALEMLVK